MLLRVYYLDDELDLLEMFFDTFSSDKIEVTTFSDPTVFLQAIKSDPPDIVFLDYRLPHTDGDKIASELSSNIKKVLVTGDLHLQCESKFDAIFRKPYRPDEVFSFLNQYFR